MASIVMDLEGLSREIERRILAEQKLKELECRLFQVKIEPTKVKKVYTFKERTPEEAAILHAKRVEAGKKGAAKRKENALKKKQLYDDGLPDLIDLTTL